jgi:hypothetical protein
MTLDLRAATLGAVLAGLIAPGVASANGRYPAAGQIALSPATPDTLLVRTTYGLALTKDGGRAWSWICEDAMGVGSQEDPMLAFAANGAILASTYGGLEASKSSGCDWAPAAAKTAVAGTPTGLYAIDLAMEKGDASKGVGLVAATATGITYVVETSDDGASWTQTGVPLPASFVGLTLETAPSQRERLYVSGRLGPPDYPAMPGVIERSDDRGATWHTLFIEGKDVESSPYISGVDPDNPDVLYVRLDGATTDRLVVSKDGGATWTQVFGTSLPAAMGDTSNLLGFALSPDGATVAVGGPKDGLWTAPTSTLAFARVSSMSALCLTWGKGGLYGCADELNDGFTAGVSSDGGQSWTPLLHRAGLCGPLACATDSAVTKRCTSLWPLLSPGIGDPSCNGAAAGSAGATASSSSHGGSAGATASDGGGGCACAFVGTGTYEVSAASVPSVLLGALALGGRRRRGRREG